MVCFLGIWLLILFAALLLLDDSTNGSSIEEIEKKMFSNEKMKKLPTLPSSFIDWPTYIRSDDLKYWMAIREESYKPFCDNGIDGFRSTFKLINIQSNLPDGCSNLKICNSTNCIEFGFSSLYFAKLNRLEFEDHIIGLSSEPTDSAFTRACKKQIVLQEPSCDNPNYCCSNKFLSFNIPGHRFVLTLSWVKTLISLYSC